VVSAFFTSDRLKHEKQHIKNRKDKKIFISHFFTTFVTENILKDGFKFRHTNTCKNEKSEERRAVFY